MEKNKNTFLYIIILSVFLFTSTTGQNADYKFLKAVNGKDMPVWDKTNEGISFSVYPAMPLTVGGIWVYGFRNDDTEMMRNAYKSAIAITLANSLSFGMKMGFKRERPFVTYPNDIKQRTHAGPMSFPSGHTTAAFATATSLSLSVKKWEVVVPAYLYAGLVGYSRMRLGVHYPSDVLAGTLIGIGSGFLVWQIDKAIKK